MPKERRTLSTADAAQLSAAMFTSFGPESFGVELEWPVHAQDDVAIRPSAQDIAMLAVTKLPARGRLTFEPGGQVELSTAPARSAVDALRAADIDTQALTTHLQRAGFSLEAIALDTRRTPRRTLQRPRYQAMEHFFAQQGPAGAWMMCNSASTQVNIGLGSSDPYQRWHTLHLISPVLIAAFANSPGIDASGQKWASLRQGVWWAIDPTRTRPVRTDLAPEVAWLQYSLAANVMFIRTARNTGEGVTVCKPGFSFARWMTEGHATGWPTVEDYRYHLTTLFPPIRPRCWLELRVLDALPSWIRDVAVLSVATACTGEASRELHERLPDTRNLWITAAREGLDHPILDKAARILSEVVSEHLGTVSTDSHHADIVEEYAARFVNRGCSPGADTAIRSQSLAQRHAPDLTRL
jgi:glutamate--cysteine ligase